MLRRLLLLCLGAIIVLGTALFVAGCTGDDESEPSGSAEPGEGGQVSNTIVQVGELTAPSAGSESAADGWETDAARMLGIRLIAQLDSSGPDAWDASEHPLVYVTAQGPGYGGILAANADESSAEGSSTEVQTAPGIAIIDAETREPVASVQYTSEVEAYTENHGLGVSPDGQWIYTQGNDPASNARGHSTLMIINARTLKIDKLIETRVHHVKVIHDSFNDRDLVLVEGWGTFFALDPNDDHRVVGAVEPSDLRGSGYLGFGDPSGKWLFITLRTAFRNHDGGVAVVSLEDWDVKTFINTGDGSPVWVAFASDGHAFVSGGHSSTVARIDMSAEDPAEWTVDGFARAGAEGPYGLTLNWDESMIFAIGKGEGSHNQGISVGYNTTNNFPPPDSPRTGRPLGELITACLREDHAIVHPDPEKNEMWISCNSSFDNVIVEMGTPEVVAVVPQPNGGSSHNGAFVRYASDWTGELLSDTNGFHGSAVEVQQGMLAAAASR